MTVSLVCIAFAAGAWLALTVRALVAQHGHRRIERAAVAALEPEHLDRLRAYLSEIDSHERERLSA